jgi:glutamate-ammonia-ligase adenylyltransferase
MWWERACALQDFPAIYGSLSEQRRAELPRVVAASEFAAAALIQDSQALAWFECCERGGQQATLAANLDYERRAAGAPDMAATMRILREWRRREMLRIAWRDIAGRAALTDTLEDVSALADACIRAACQVACRDETLIVIGMGKLGGRVRSPNRSPPTAAAAR